MKIAQGRFFWHPTGWAVGWWAVVWWPVVALSLFFCFIVGCRDTVRHDSSALINIVATTGMVGDLVRGIGGSRVSVVDLMGPGVDPHLYKATQGDLAALAGAEMIFYNGLHLEGKMGEVFESLARTKPCVAVTRDIDRTKLRTPPEFEGNFDPHIWFDVALWAESLGVVAEELSKLSPSYAKEFEARKSEIAARFRDLDSWVRGEISTIPRERRVLVTAHDAFGYFGRAYDVDVVGLQGVSTASEFGLRDITRVSDIVIARSVKAVFVESSVPERLVKALIEGLKARGHDVKIGGSLYSESFGAKGSDNGTYEGMVRHNVKTIVAGLK